MRQTQQAGTGSRFAPGGMPSPDKPLPDQIAEAIRCRATPLSQLLRLMSALDAQDDGDEGLRLQLRARIGAPLDA